MSEVYDAWMANSLASKVLPADAREAPALVVPLNQKVLQKSCEDNTSKSWHLNADVVASTLEFRSEEEIEQYLQEVEDTTPNSKYVSPFC